MKSIRKMSVLVGIATLWLTASSLKAQITAGSFTLPHEVDWGTAVLPAGDYTFTLDHIGLDGMIAIRRGTKTAAFVTVGGMKQASYSNRSSMLIVEHRVRTLHLANLGLEYNFPARKSDRELLARRTGVQELTMVAVSTK